MELMSLSASGIVLMNWWSEMRQILADSSYRPHVARYWPFGLTSHSWDSVPGSCHRMLGRLWANAVMVVADSNSAASAREEIVMGLPPLCLVFLYGGSCIGFLDLQSAKCRTMALEPPGRDL